MAKYAVRPVNPVTKCVYLFFQYIATGTHVWLFSPEPVPLSAFVVEDMVELQQAHATYRFVIVDEEEERPRMLVRVPACCLLHKSSDTVSRC
jgi:hypothetical protein